MTKHLYQAFCNRVAGGIKRVNKNVVTGICVLVSAFIAGCTTPGELLSRAIEQGNATEVTKVLRKNYYSKSPQWALGDAAAQDKIEIVRLLLGSGADIDGGSPTALMLAAKNGHLNIVRYLVEHDADVNRQGDATIISSAQTINNGRGQRLAILHLRKIAGAGASALTYAIRAKHLGIVKYLLQHGASYNEPQVYQESGVTVFPLLSSDWNTTVEVNANLVRRPLVATPIDLARSLGDQQIMSLFERGTGTKSRNSAIRLVTRATSLGQFDSGSLADTIKISPHGRYVAFAERQGRKTCVVVDGKKGKPYGAIGTIFYSPNGKHVAYKAKQGNQWLLVLDGKARGPGWVTFSHNDKHLAYAVHRGNQWLVVVDGKKSEPYKGTAFNFSPNGKHFAYWARRGNQRFLVMDGKKGKAYDGAMEGPVFSANGKHVAYVALRGKKAVLVVDGKEGKPYDGYGAWSIHFSANGKHVAFVALRGTKAMVVVDGKAGKAYDGIGFVVFSHDGNHVAYEAMQGKHWFAVVDDKQSRAYDGIGASPLRFHIYTHASGARDLIVSMLRTEYIRTHTVIFSPDSKHVAYEAKQGGKEFVVMDGREGKAYDEIDGRSLMFSPDGKHMAYTAHQGNKAFVVVDGKAGKAYDSIGAHSLNFSADGRHIAYTAKEGYRWFVVVDGKAGKVYGQLGSGPVFSPDSKHLAYEAQWTNKWLIVVDATEGVPFSGFVEGSKLVWDSPDSLHDLAVRNKAIYRVQVRIVKNKR